MKYSTYAIASARPIDKKQIKIKIRDTEPDSIIFGCSHSYGYKINKEETIEYILRQNNVNVLNMSRPGAGIHSLCMNELKLVKSVIDTKKIKHVIIQAPFPVRSPTCTKDFFKLKGRIKRYLFKKIAKADAGCIRDFVISFPNSKIVLWRYWIDDLPFFKEYYSKFDTLIKDFNIKNLGFILSNQQRGDVFVDINSYGWRLKRQRKIWKAGWIIGEYDIHPSEKFHRIAADKILKWINDD